MNLSEILSLPRVLLSKNGGEGKKKMMRSSQVIYKQKGEGLE